jgi:hypothetical protein
MYAKRSSYFPLLLTAIVLLASACQPVAIASTGEPTVTPVILVTQNPVQPTQIPAPTTGEIVLDYTGLAQNMAIEKMPPVSAGESGPILPAGPEYHLATLHGYPVTGNSLKPQIFIYPVGDLALANQNAGNVTTDLQDLLQTRQPGETLPFLPLISAKQVLHSQVQYLDFKNGKGVRFLTQFNTGIVKINNAQLIYTFQGLTNDGRFYVSAILPVTHADLPDTEEVFSQNLADMSGYPAYLTQTTAWLDQQPAKSFAPDLAKLDALVQSIEIQ